MTANNRIKHWFNNSYYLRCGMTVIRGKANYTAGQYCPPLMHFQAHVRGLVKLGMRQRRRARLQLLLERFNFNFNFTSLKSMIMRVLSIALMVLVLCSCNAQTRDLTDSMDIKAITLDGLQRDSIVALLTAQSDTLNIFREIEIIENQNTDTLLLGYSIIHPGYIGKIWFIQSGLDSAGGVYLDKSQPLDPSDPVSFAKLFTIGVLRQRYENGFKKIVLRLKVKPNTGASPVD